MTTCSRKTRRKGSFSSCSWEPGRERFVHNVKEKCLCCLRTRLLTMLQAQWLIRSLEGKLRIGLAEKTVQVALAHAIVLTRTDLQGALPGGWWGVFFTAADALLLPRADKRARLGLEERMRVAAETLKEVFNELPNYNILIPVILKEVQTFRTPPPKPRPLIWALCCHLL